MSETPTIQFGILEKSLGFHLRLAQLHGFATFYDDMSHLGVKPGELSVLLMIEANPGIRQGVLARSLLIKRAHMTKMVRAMEDAGLVKRRVPADDKRAVTLWLSEAGSRTLADVKPTFAKHVARPSPNLTHAEEQTLKILLRKHLGLNAAGKDKG